MFTPEAEAQIARLGFTGRPRQVQGYEYAINWDTVAASGGSLSSQVVIDNSTPFVVVAYGFRAYLAAADTAAGANVQIGTELSRIPGDTRLITASGPLGNSMYSINMLTIQMDDSTQGAWHRQPINPVTLFGVTDVQPAFFQRVIAPGATVTGILTNGAGVAIDADLTLVGYRLYF